MNLCHLRSLCINVDGTLAGVKCVANKRDEQRKIMKLIRGIARKMERRRESRTRLNILGGLQGGGAGRGGGGEWTKKR